MRAPDAPAKTRRMRSFLFLALATVLSGVFVATPAAAQFDAGLILGVSTYEGELTPSKRLTQLAQVGPAIGAFGRYEFSKFAAVRGYYQFLQIEGADADRPTSRSRNLSFASDLHEIGAMLEFYPLSTDRKVAPYLMFGAAAVAYNPKTRTEDGILTELRPLGTEGQGIDGFAPKYKRFAGAFPLGGGLRFNLASRLVLGVEAIGRITTADYLDDVGGSRYVPTETFLLENRPLAAALAYRGGELAPLDPTAQLPPQGVPRGNPDTKDLYLSGQATISYRFGDSAEMKTKFRRRSKDGCPTF